MDDKERLMQQQLDINWVLSTSQGRSFLWRILSYCGIYHDIEGQGDGVFKQIGRRQVGLHLLGIITEASEEKLFEMMKEAKNRATEEKIKNEHTNNTSTSKYSSSGTSQLDDLIGSVELPSYANDSGSSGPIF